MAVLGQHRENASIPDGDDTALSTPLSSPASESYELCEALSDVESLVYYFSVEIRPIRASIKNYSFFLDPLRSKMTLKWMKFYSYSPQLTGDTHKQRRTELKKHLKLLPGQFSQQLGSFMVDKFWSLKHRGWISGDIDKPPVKYHECTNHWLDHSWDGVIEPLAREAMMKHVSLKRAAPALSSGRQKSVRHPVVKALRVRNRAHKKAWQQKAPVPKIYDLVALDEPIDDNESRNTNSCSQLIDASPTPIQEFSQMLEIVSTDTHFDASELSMRLERISKDKATSKEQILQSTSKATIMEDCSRQDSVTRSPTTKESNSESSVVQNPIGKDSSITSTPPQTLEALVKSARSCKKACNAIVADIKDLKPIRDQLCADYDKLYEEIKNFHVDILEARKRLKHTIPPTPAFGTDKSSASYKKGPEIYRKVDSPEWLESRKAAKAVLLQEITKMEENYTDLQAQYGVKAAELQELRSAVKERKASVKRYSTEVGYLLEDFGKNSDWVDPDSQWISDTDVDSDEED